MDERREWMVAVNPNKCGEDTIESVAHWNIGLEVITVREVPPGDHAGGGGYRSEDHAKLVEAARAVLPCYNAVGKQEFETLRKLLEAEDESL